MILSVLKMLNLKFLFIFFVLVFGIESLDKNVFKMEFTKECIPGLTDQCYLAGNDTQVKDYFENIERKTNHVVNFVIEEMVKAKLDSNME